VRARCRGRFVDILLVDPSPGVAGGPAFATTNPEHILNTVAQDMTADPADPDGFSRWVRANRGALHGNLWRLGGSDAQREIVEDTEMAALLSAARHLEARDLLDARLSRRASPRDEALRLLTTVR
jgi:uncharacterized NAD(P)/FAD-binding protein YdhS